MSAPLPARIERVRVRPGQRVARGEAVLDVVMPELVQSSAALTAAGLRLQAYQRQRQRLEPLVRDGLVLNADLIAIDTQISGAKAERETARAVLLSAGMNEESARALFARTATVALRAPIAGVVTRVQVRPGEMREPLSGPLLEIMGTGDTTIEARFSISPDAGSAFEWLGEGGPMPLTIESVSPVVSEDGARLVWLKPRSQAAMSAGALGRVRVVAPEAWVAVPRSALEFRDGQAFVYVPEGNGRSARKVTLVQTMESEAIVTGLAVGDAVFQDQTVTEP